MNKVSLDQKGVAIFIPVYKQVLSPDELISIQHLITHLGHYDKFLVVPDGLEFSLPDFAVKCFAPHYFDSVKSFDRLMLSEEFFGAFLDYKYILSYQLDCLVFSDQLREWCVKGYDYIGAPWFKTPDLGWTYDGPERAGNGGFALIHVAHMLEAIRRSNQIGLADIVQAIRAVRLSRPYSDLKSALLLKRNAATTFPYGADIWWSFQACKYMPELRIAPPDVAVSFAFETTPRYCFEKNGQRLPFGCHAWARYDRKFWEPYCLDREWSLNSLRIQTNKS